MKLTEEFIPYYRTEEVFWLACAKESIFKSITLVIPFSILRIFLCINSKKVLSSSEMKEDYFISHSYANLAHNIWYSIKEKIFLGETISEDIMKLKTF